MEREGRESETGRELDKNIMRNGPIERERKREIERERERVRERARTQHFSILPLIRITMIHNQIQWIQYQPQ